jgi:ubiquinone biosynthesis protein COQ9
MQAEAPTRSQQSPTAPDWADRAEQRLLEAAIPLTARLGWNAGLIAGASPAAGLSAGEADLLLPNGPRDLAALFSRRLDARAMAALATRDPATLKIRERIRSGLEAWLDAADADPGAAKRWAAFLALPPNAGLGLRLAWESADRLWRWAGDTATDENHYTKRAILGAILVSALGLRLSAGRDVAAAYVDRRIENVMQFERWKAGVKVGGLAERLAQGLGRLRYGRG